MDGWDGIGLSYTAVTPRASLQSDANNIEQNIFHLLHHTQLFCCLTPLFEKKSYWKSVNGCLQGREDESNQIYEISILGKC